MGVDLSKTTVVVHRDVEIPMRDGAVLRADVWRPATNGRYPVLLQRTPYDKSLSFLTITRAGIEPLRAVNNGYVVVVQDARGCFRSEGTFRPFVNEEQDGHDTIAWLQTQDYCDGDVFMYGSSYVGATQLLAAVSTPRGLRAIVPQWTASEYYEGWSYRGGALELGFLLYWAIGSFMGPELSRHSDRPDAEELHQAFLRLSNNPYPAYEVLPLTAHAALNELVPAYRSLLEHPRRDDFWLQTSVRERYADINVPALHIAGWFDIFGAGTIENFVRLRSEAGTQIARDCQYLIVGPWAHGNPWDAGGGMYFGGLSALSTFDPTALHLSFFDAVRHGKQPDWPRVRVFDLGALEWRAYENWPPSQSRPKRLYLAASGPDKRRLGRLLDVPEDAPSAHYRYDPADPVPTVGGSGFLPGLQSGLNSGPRDQRELDGREDVLVYTSPQLREPILLAGPVKVHLTAETSADDTDWTAKLVRVTRDGKARLLAEGILRARYAGGTDQARFLEPRQPHKLEISLGHTCVRFDAGDRLRLDVSSSNFPRFDRNPNTTVEPATATAADFVIANQTLYGDTQRLSYLEITVLD